MADILMYDLTDRAYGPSMKSQPTVTQGTETAIASVQELGTLIRQVRKAQGMTQEDVSGLAGFGNRFIIDLERGKATVQAQKVLDVLALLGLELVVRKV